MRYLIPSLALCLVCACSQENKGQVQASSPNKTTKTMPDPNAKPLNKDGSKDMAGKEVTAMDQSNVQAEVELTARVRRALVDDATLSVGAKNVTVVSKAGTVTLRGSVASAEEQAHIKSLVTAVEGVKEVDDQLQINP